MVAERAAGERLEIRGGQLFAALRADRVVAVENDFLVGIFIHDATNIYRRARFFHSATGPEG